MPRKIRVGFQLTPLNSSRSNPNRLHAYYLLLYTRYLLVPRRRCGLRGSPPFQVSTRTRPRKGAQTHREKREREREKSVRIWGIFACSIDLIEEFVCLLRWLGACWWVNSVAARREKGEKHEHVTKRNFAATILGSREREGGGTVDGQARFYTNRRVFSKLIFPGSYGLLHVFSRLSRRKVSFMSRSRWISRKGCKSNNENVRTSLCWYTAIICTYVLPVKSQFESCAVSRPRKIYENSSRNFLIQTKLTFPFFPYFFFTQKEKRKKKERRVRSKSFVTEIKAYLLCIDYMEQKLSMINGEEGSRGDTRNRRIDRHFSEFGRGNGVKERKGGGRW